MRKGNPKGIKDWGDLTKEGVEVITPNPKTSGGARWNYLAAWAWADGKFGHNEDKNKEFIKDLFAHVPVLDTGARGSTTTFAQREIGDVLLAWENEAFLAIDELGADKFEIVVPSLSIKAEPPVTIVDKVVDAKGSRKVAEAYLNFLYTPEAPEADRPSLLSPVRSQIGRSQGPRTLRRREARRHRRSSVRRMGQGAAEALRRRRDFRPGLPAEIDQLDRTTHT